MHEIPNPLSLTSEPYSTYSRTVVLAFIETKAGDSIVEAQEAAAADVVQSVLIDVMRQS
jgi:hypothetical protein